MAEHTDANGNPLRTYKRNDTDKEHEQREYIHEKEDRVESPCTTCSKDLTGIAFIIQKARPFCNWGCYKIYKENSAKEANKFDDNKLRYDLLPVGPLADIARVFTHGAKKYGDNNWRIGKRWGAMIAATERHMQAFKTGEDMDGDSGLPHLAHAAVEIMFLLEYAHTCKDLDDRYPDQRKIDFIYKRIKETNHDNSKTDKDSDRK